MYGFLRLQLFWCDPESIKCLELCYFTLISRKPGIKLKLTLKRIWPNIQNYFCVFRFWSSAFFSWWGETILGEFIYADTPYHSVVNSSHVARLVSHTSSKNPVWHENILFFIIFYSPPPPFLLSCTYVWWKWEKEENILFWLLTHEIAPFIVYWMIILYTGDADVIFLEVVGNEMFGYRFEVSASSM